MIQRDTTNQCRVKGSQEASSRGVAVWVDPYAAPPGFVRKRPVEALACWSRAPVQPLCRRLAWGITIMLLIARAPAAGDLPSPLVEALGASRLYPAIVDESLRLAMGGDWSECSPLAMGVHPASAQECRSLRQTPEPLGRSGQEDPRRADTGDRSHFHWPLTAPVTPGVGRPYGSIVRSSISSFTC
jgi:hypothetical protein